MTKWTVQTDRLAQRDEIREQDVCVVQTIRKDEKKKKKVELRGTTARGRIQFVKLRFPAITPHVLLLEPQEIKIKPAADLTGNLLRRGRLRENGKRTNTNNAIIDEGPAGN